MATPTDPWSKKNGGSHLRSKWSWLTQGNITHQEWCQAKWHNLQSAKREKNKQQQGQGTKTWQRKEHCNLAINTKSYSQKWTTRKTIRNNIVPEQCCSPERNSARTNKCLCWWGNQESEHLYQAQPTSLKLHESWEECPSISSWTWQMEQYAANS